MSSHISSSRSRGQDGPLWLVALGIALCLNFGALLVFGWMFLRFDAVSVSKLLPAPPSEPVVTVELMPMEAAPKEVTPELAKRPEARQQFTRTSPDQVAPLDRPTHRIGERETRATSERAPDPTAPPLPSQDGVAPRDKQDIETTVSDYQDGSLKPKVDKTPVEVDPVATPAPDLLKPATDVTSPNPTPSLAETRDPVKDLPPREDSRLSLTPRERLLEGPDPVDVAVPKEVADAEKIQLPPPRPEPPAIKPADVVTPAPADAIKPTPPEEKSFSGFQRKTVVTGSITRTGRSALDVDDSDLGKYQAQISRAVELEWQRNCVRHRDFITPGFLTVRFYVEASGKVKSVQFVGDMETGEVQKGFTLNSIRNAEIPAMPQKLKEVYEDDPLELLYRFYF